MHRSQRLGLGAYARTILVRMVHGERATFEGENMGDRQVYSDLYYLESGLSRGLLPLVDDRHSEILRKRFGTVLSPILLICCCGFAFDVKIAKSILPGTCGIRVAPEGGWCLVGVVVGDS